MLSSEGAAADDDYSLDAIWDEKSSETLQMDRDCDKRRDKFYTEGYRSGIFAGKDAAASFKEESLNIGFKQSLLEGYKFGFLRGVSSALTLLPDELKEKLMSDEEETRDKFHKLHHSLLSLSTQNAINLFYGTREERVGQEEENVGSALGTFVSELTSLLDKSPKIQVSCKDLLKS
ncbi:hypothetical protein N665_0748s0012 [Sinapis alba]|nr:hypothetical protein N665_0748s0012 [Sinapis alba]